MTIAQHLVGIIVEDGTGRILCAGRALGEVLGAADSCLCPAGSLRVECIERMKFLFCDPAMFVRRTEELAAIVAQPTSETFPLADGRVLRCDHVPVLVDGELRERLWIFRDSSDHQRAREQAGVYERLSAAVEQTADSVMITDVRGCIEYVNPAFERTTGFGRDEVLGRTPRILKSGRHDAEFYRHLWSEVISGRPFQGTIVNRKRNGELYTAQQTITPMIDERGKVTHFVAVLRDISDLLRQNEQDVEMRLAREVQQRYYRGAVQVPGCDIAGVALPANETGGDYFDFIPMPDDSVGIAIGDVSGHGLRCALVMAEVRAYLRAFAATSSDVAWILTRVNRALEPDLERGDFVTLLLARLDPKRRSLEYANAGHLPPGYLMGRDGTVVATLPATGPPLGVLPDFEYAAGDALAVGAGQLLLLMTDGVTESIAPEEPESGELHAIAYVAGHRSRPAREIAAGICRAAQDAAANPGQQDDITSVVLKLA